MFRINSFMMFISLSAVKRSVVAFIAVGLSLFTAAQASADDHLRIYAASSMTNVLNEIIESYESQSGVRITPVYGGSSSLARQIERGAPSDIFISANRLWMNYLVEQSVVEPSNMVVLASNQLVLVSSNPDINVTLNSIDSWKAALGDSRLATGSKAVPVGMYAQQAFESLNVWSELNDKIAPTNSVRMALALVEQGEAPLGVVYRTDALYSEDVYVVQSFPTELHEPIVYPMALLSDQPQAQAFYHFLRGDAVTKVLVKHGFSRP